MKIRPVWILAVLLGMAACGPRGAKVPAGPAVRAFPMPEVPALYTAPGERADYLAGHFWDQYLDTVSLYACDSVTLNGVGSEALERAVGTYVTVLETLPVSTGRAATADFFRRLESFGKKYPDSGVYEGLSALLEKYLYDPNSPVRDEDLWEPVAGGLGASVLTPEDRRAGYRFAAEKARLNQRGTPAADFRFTDTAGRSRTLYGIRAEYLLLIFGNPDCQGCREILSRMGAEPRIAALMEAGRLKVVDVYIDRDIAAWKAGIRAYPATWINGYDPTGAIRSDLLYNVRALPSLYLLDKDKTVLLKDAPEERILQFLQQI